MGKRSAHRRQWHAYNARTRGTWTQPQPLSCERGLCARNHRTGHAGSGADLSAPHQLRFKADQMSTTITSITTPALHSARPDFFGTVRGELFKISRQWTTWIVLVLLTGIIFLPYLIRLTVSNTKDAINHDTLAFLYGDMSNNLAILRAFAGFALIILTARVIGLEYQLGTIRVLLARGVGRLQLLSAKLLAIVIVALTLFAGGILLDGILTCALVAILTGSLNALNALTSTFWSNTWLYVLSVLISMGVTILLAAAVTVVGRSLSF